MTRRSFCFLFGAGVAGATVAAAVGAKREPYWYIDHAGEFHSFGEEQVGMHRYKVTFVTESGDEYESDTPGQIGRKVYRPKGKSKTLYLAEVTDTTTIEWL